MNGGPRPDAPDRPAIGARLCWIFTITTALAALTAAVLLPASPAALLPGDLPLHRLLLEHRDRTVVTVLRAVTATGTGVYPYLAAVTAGLIAARAMGDRSAAARPAVRTGLSCAAFAGWLALGQAARFALMTFVARPRPPAVDWLTPASRYAFPSGHTTTSAIAGGLLLLALWTRRPRAWHLWACLAVGWAFLVGISRMWLGVHWMSDVVAGWLLAAAWTVAGAAAATATGLLRPRSAPLRQ